MILHQKQIVKINVHFSHVPNSLFDNLHHKHRFSHIVLTQSCVLIVSSYFLVKRQFLACSTRCKVCRMKWHAKMLSLISWNRNWSLLKKNTDVMKIKQDTIFNFLNLIKVFLFFSFKKKICSLFLSWIFPFNFSSLSKQFFFQFTLIHHDFVYSASK